MELADRAKAYAALGDESRLAIVELLAHGDLAPSELGTELGLPTNLMAHHLQLLEAAGLIVRRRSEGDGRRSYVRRTPACDQLLGTSASLPRPRRVAFVCAQNSARSQLAEAYWRRISDIPVLSAGMHPAMRVHPRAVSVGRRHGLDLAAAQPKLAKDVLDGEELVIAVCDRAYEELGNRPLHWSIPDPARTDSDAAFERAYLDLTARVELLAAQLTEDLT